VDNITTRQAVEQVLTGKRKPMRVRAIIETAVPIRRLGVVSRLSGLVGVPTLCPNDFLESAN
jgi:hypothetical protein